MSVRGVIAGWRLTRREARLCRRLIKNMDHRSLKDLLVFEIEEDRPFPIHKSKVRTAIFSIYSWKIGGRPEDLLFSSVESYLFDNVQDSQKGEWQSWLRSCRMQARHIDVMNPGTSRALLDAQNLGKLSDIPKEDYDFLLGCYLHTYGGILEKTGPGDRQEALAVLLEYAAIAQLVGPDESSIRVLRRWAEHQESRPRALTTMSDEQAHYAPLRGVGSPHGVTLTIYDEPASTTPVRMSCAGTTGDTTLNSQVFTSLFAAALACDSEPTFITSGGSTLSLKSRDRGSASYPSQSILSVVIGPGGPVEPSSGTPSLGMNAEQAMWLASDMFQRFQDSTGLVQVMHWQTADAHQFEHRITRALKMGDGPPRVVKSDARHSEGASVVHVIPLLHRDAKGAVVPIEIELPYRLLGPERVFRMLSDARQTYMQRLIAEGRRRQLYAEDVHRKQDEKIREWASRTEASKREACRRIPTFTITGQFHFVLGISVPLDSPEQIARRDFEESMRPKIRDQAKEWAERFEDLCGRLEDLNKTGGKADILTFKLLVDSMIRQAPIAIAHRNFQSEYERWVKLSSIPVWAAIAEWAKSRRLSPETLAADNIVFNARLEGNRKSVLIQPWVVVDLHDSAVYVNCREGLMEVFPAGKTPTLADTLIPDPENGITDLRSLHDRFCSWAVDSIQLLNERERREDDVRSKILGDHMVGAVVQLRRAKRLLFKGDARQAIECIEAIRSADLAPIYFWGAVAHQYRFLGNYRYLGGIDGLRREERIERRVSVAIGTLIEFLKLESKFSVNQMLPAPAAGRHSVPVDGEAQEFLRQMQARDESFVQGLLRDKPKIWELERQSLHLSSDYEERVSAAISALSSLELLRLAEFMKQTAKALPVTGRWTSDLQRDVEMIIQQAESLTFRDSAVAAQIEDLAKLFAGASRLG
jgi:hypothetical protein